MKRKNSLFLKFIPMVLALVLIISGCGGNANNEGGGESGDGEQVEITMSAWGNPAEIKVYQKAVDAFMEENPDIKVKLVPIPGDGYQDKIFTQLSGGQAPDVFYVGSEWISKLRETGTVAELSEFLNSAESYVKPDEFAEGLWGAAKQGGEIYGVTVDSNPFVMYYNKKVLEEAGVQSPQELYENGEWTWDKFEEVTGKIKDAGKKGFVVDNWWGPMFSWVWTNGGKMYDEEGNIVLGQNEKAQEAIKYLDTMIEKGNFEYAGSLPKGQGGDAMFMSNQAGFVAAGRWFTPMFSENEQLEFDYIPWPTNTGNKQETVAVATAYMSVSEESEHLEEAMKFMSYYTSAEGQKARLAGNGNAVPSVQGVDEIVTEAEVPEHAEYLIDARDIGKVDDKQSVIPGLDGEVMDLMDLMYLGKKSAEETITDVVELAEKMISEHKSE
jgi:multiple sugar transport system substrate-binding protein